MRGQRVRIRMRGDQRRVREPGDVPEALLVEVREVEHDSQAVAGLHQGPPGIGEPGPRVGTGGKAEGNAVPEDRRPAPDRSERAQAALVQDIQHVVIRVDRLRPLEVEHGGERLSLHRASDLAGAAADLHLPLGGALDAKHQRGHVQRDWLRLRQGKGLGQGDVVARPRHDLVDARVVRRRGRRSRTARLQNRRRACAANRAGRRPRRRGRRAPPLRPLWRRGAAERRYGRRRSAGGGWSWSGSRSHRRATIASRAFAAAWPAPPTCAKAGRHRRETAIGKAPLVADDTARTGTNTMWGGRFSAAPDALMEAINASIGFDRRLAAQDIAGSMAHAAMLAQQGIIAGRGSPRDRRRPRRRSRPRSRRAASPSRARSRTST